tara:strand:- start:5013 stop:5693 length:681 start_codon:yes stop_codon:yes gene_type:complete
MREIVLDTETTGLDFKNGDRIIEVACLELYNHIATGNTLQFYCSTEKKISKDVVEIHGLTNEFLDKHKTFEQQYKKIIDFIKNDTLVIHNADFDLGFINNELKLIGAKPIQNECIDTVKLAKTKLNTRLANLDFLCKRFSIDLSARKLHGALLDCQLLSEVYLELTGGKQTSLDLKKHTNNPKERLTKTKTNTHIIEKIKIKDEEILSHKEFSKSIKNSLWSKLDY